MLPRIEISIASQVLHLYLPGTESVFQCYAISSAKNGLGEVKGSHQTPRGQLQICAKFGGGLPIRTVFQGRIPTGEYYSSALGGSFPERDWILSRILWLEGTELGLNKSGNVDTKARYIYLHGTPEECPMGIPLSHGCIRMRNVDIMALYPLVPVGTSVSIRP